MSRKQYNRHWHDLQNLIGHFHNHWGDLTVRLIFRVQLWGLANFTIKLPSTTSPTPSQMENVNIIKKYIVGIKKQTTVTVVNYLPLAKKKTQKQVFNHCSTCIYLAEVS